jgi:hypothetical protein
MERTKTNRGFALYEFEDRNGEICTVQKSSIATEDAIWLGARDLRVQEFIAYQGWKDVVFENTPTHHFVGNERMHLTQSQVKELIPILQKFVDTGEI